MVHIKKYNHNIGGIILDRPKKAHAYTTAMITELSAGINSLAECSVVIIESTEDGAFCAGADLNELRQRAPSDAHHLQSQRVFEQLSRAPWLSIAALQGAAVAGGFELALACDLRIFGAKASCSFPEVRLGLVPSAGGCTRLKEMVGKARATEMILGQRIINSETALDWGIAQRISEDPRSEAKRWAAELATQDPIAMRLAKQLLAAPTLARERVSEAVLYGRLH